jgi:hypothetical protein
MEHNSIQILKSLSPSHLKNFKGGNVPFVKNLITIWDKANEITNNVFSTVETPSITKFISLPIIRPPITSVVSPAIINNI